MKHLLLNGFMATGKSTIGPIVAKELDLAFFDVDEEIESRCGKGIGEIFRQDGESRFRGLETDVLLSLLKAPASVIAGGGGVLQDNDNRATAESDALIITLTCPVEELVRRATNDGATLRPVLFRALTASGGSGTDAIANLLQTRSWLYDAYPSVATNIGSPEDAAERVVSIYRRYERAGEGAPYELPFPGSTTSEILFSSHQLEDGPAWIVAGGRRSVAVVCDENTARLFGARMSDSLVSSGIETDLIVIKAGEAEKSLRTAEHIYSRLQAAGLDRGAAIVALGGGVVSDIAGFTAATYLRGIDLINVPTTLLAQVDASIGGKTGIDFGGVKNLVGSFFPAQRVIIDSNPIRSLPLTRLREGLAEMVKIAFVRDAGFLAQLEELTDSKDILERADLVRRAVRNKVEAVKADPLERGTERSLLNFGHTIGHAIESASDYDVSHGECVAIGMVTEARLAQALGAVEPANVKRLLELLRRLGLPTETPQYPADVLLQAVRQDKKRTGGNIRVVVTTGVGAAELRTVTEDEILSALNDTRVAV